MAPKQEVFELHPRGWENDPERETFDVSTLDYLTSMAYNNYCLFFKMDDSMKARAVEIMKEGLERTIAQARHLCCTIEKEETGSGYVYVKNKDSTVRLFVQYLDAPEDADKYPSLEDIEKANFSAVPLGDLKLWSVEPMTYGEKPEAHPDASPVVSAFKMNFVRGGLVFNMHHHHYANDVMGWAGYTRQLAENCFAALNKTEFPPWDPKNMDLSRLCKQEPPEDQKIDGPPAPQRHPDHVQGVCLLFHLPKSKAAELKKLAQPTEPGQPWISTYDAFTAFIWRAITRVRAPVFKPDPASKLFLCEAVDMRRRLHSPKVPPRIRGNVMFAALSTTAPVEPPTVAEIISEWPLSKLAQYIRGLTNSITQESLDKTLEMVATIKDKTTLNIRIDSLPPMSVLFTDHRDAITASTDFGFGKPITYRHLTDRVTEGVIIVYPPRSSDPASDEGPEFSFFYEKRLAQDLIDDEEFGKYFEYRGVDAEDATAPALLN
ncbi:transferase family domain-containing protein [Trichoderma novae-zelandiae]